MEAGVAGSVLTVQTRRPSDDFWMVWDQNGIVGSVRSRSELTALIEKLGVNPVDVRYDGDSLEQLREDGFLPTDRS